MSKLIECKALSKNYGSTKALQAVDLSLDAGAPIALVGSNGAGKTTLLSLLCGYIRPSSGNVSVMGHRAGSQQAIRHISALPQDAQLDPGFTVGLQLKHYAQLRGVRKAAREVSRVLSLVQLQDRINASATELSHGMRKRVLLAQSLIGQPQLVLLDEPTAGIDPPNVKIIRDLITREAANATFIVSSHNLDELEKVCSTVVHLAAGELRAVNAIDDVNNDGMISIILRTGATPDKQELAQVSGVTSVTMRTPTELVVEYDHQQYPQTDITVLQSLADQQVSYRRLVKGRSLEDQVFD